MQQYLESKLYSDVEGTCSGQFGFIIAVVSISDIGKGMVISGNGQAEFITRYRAIVFKPFKGEVVDGVVHNVTRVRGLIRYSSPYSGPRESLNLPSERTDGHFCRSRPSKLFRLAAGT
jgi:DNA-directed RNA polymerase subunit E'/Rpb7